MTRRLTLAILLAVLLTGPALLASGAASGGPSDRKQEIDERIARLQARIAEAQRKEGVLTSEISDVTGRIRGLEDDIGRASGQLASIESELVVYKNRLAQLTQLWRLQTEKLILLREQDAIAQDRLNLRLVQLYQSEETTAVEVVLSASSFTDVVDGLDYLNQIGQADRLISLQVADSKRRMRIAREGTRRTRKRVAETTRVIAARAAEQRAQRDRLLASQSSLADARSSKQRTLEQVAVDERELRQEVDDLQAASRALASRLQSIQSSAPSGGPVDSTVSSSGMIWPISGTVTSNFGWRWGRMHEGIDIAAPSGAPIVAAGAGNIVVAGWMGGYGLMVVIDHGGGLATAYAHMSALGVGAGQSVAQGQTIGYIGCTGSCTGPHTHFEVRANGSPVDPLGYL